MSDLAAMRLRRLNDAPVRREGDYVLYWMIASRRVEWSFAVERAAHWSRELGLPLLVLEPLRCDYPWASDRLHRFVLDGMAETRRRLERVGVRYYPYVEPRPGAGRGLLEALGRGAAVVVTDRFPGLFLPQMAAAAGRRLAVRLEEVDGNGLLPLAAAPRAYHRAYDFRRFLQRELPEHLLEPPLADPLAEIPSLAPAEVPRQVREGWPPAPPELLAPGAALAELPIDHSVAPPGVEGGSNAAGRALARFLGEAIDGYHQRSPDLVRPGTSGLSPYLHFGQLSPHRIFAAVADREDWHPGRLGAHADGSRQGWWGMAEGAEAFLDQLVTWRELGWTTAAHLPGHDRFESLPEWALESLAAHRGDERPHLYTRQELEGAATHDELWNAAQRQLVREGTVHGYLRMLWGKKILEWSPSARHALSTMLELNDRFALDGRDPNSVAGIFWCLGRYDRAWGPERPIFGKVRYMSSESARRKFRVAEYLERHGPAD